MKPGTVKKMLYWLCFLSAILWKNLDAAYLEGIDTTDENGYGVDSAFQVTPEGKIIAKNCLPYGLFGGESGPLNYSFDEIKYAAASGYHGLFMNVGGNDITVFTCFVLKKNDNTYSKIQIVEKLQDSRFVFKFGSNTTPSERLLESSDYNPAERYKPNNIIHHFHYGTPPDTLLWEPPLPNNNHLIGYVLYQSKIGSTIDTTKPVDITQWDSIAFTDSDLLINKLRNRCYVNMVAVYEKGRSDFINGWTFYAPTSVEIKRYSFFESKQENRITVKNTCGSLSIEVHPFFESAVLSLNSILGRRIAMFSYTGQKAYWNFSKQSIPPGLYLIRAEFPYRSAITEPFIISR